MRWMMCLIGMAAVAVSGDAWAAGSKKKDPLAWVPPTHIQMMPMMLPAGGTTVPMTFFLEAAKPKQVDEICKRIPRVRDAVLRSLSKKPIPVRGRRLVLKGLDARMLKPVNKAVGRSYVRKVFISKGAIRMGAGKIKRRPYAVIDGCENILRSEKEREQALKAAQKN
ncbi:MAG: hypothetical protein OXR84_06080 [Magnetovibrio sp.]|nr:hypothetical protein [Magnetovibrio sp.]